MVRPNICSFTWQHHHGGGGGGCSNGSESGRKMTECDRFVDVRGAGVIIPDAADFPTQPEQSNKYI